MLFLSLSPLSQSELFQEDIYPNTPGDVPAITAEEWASGEDAEPVLVSTSDTFISPLTSVFDSRQLFLTCSLATCLSSESHLLMHFILTSLFLSLLL